jgi:UPF0716 protein FxsA
MLLARSIPWQRVALLVVLFIVAPLVELYVILRVGASIGALNTIGLLIAVSVIGAWLVKRQGLAVARRLRRQLNAGGDPSRQVVDGFLVLAAGVLLVLPGFVSDVVGLALLLPPVRAIVARLLLRRAGRRRATRFVHITSIRRIDDPIDTHATDDPAGSGAGEPRQIPPGHP